MIYCYLLRPFSDLGMNKNDKYIGYTVDLPNRMLQHHGYKQNGAPKPSRKWKGQFFLVGYVEGFDSKEIAEQMEWQMKTWRRLKWHDNVYIKPNPIQYDGLKRFVRALWCPKLRHLKLTIHLTEPFQTIEIMEWIESVIPPNCKTSDEMYKAK